MTVKIYHNGAQVATKNFEFDAGGQTDTLAHAVCTVVSTCTDRANYRDYHDLPSYQISVRSVATAAARRRIEKFVTTWSGSGQGPQPEDNVVVYNPPLQSATCTYDDYHNTRHPEGTWTPTLSVYVIDEPRVPTNLLVNSFDREQVVHLVHDPATGLLVGDY